MPIYMYRCTECSHTFDTLQKASDPAPAACPECGASALKKVITPVGIIFKGSGFHKNDYSSKSKSGGGSPSGSENKGEKKAEAPSSDSASKSDAPSSDSASKSDASSASNPDSGSTSKSEAKSDKVA